MSVFKKPAVAKAFNTPVVGKAPVVSRARQRPSILEMGGKGMMDAIGSLIGAAHAVARSVSKAQVSADANPVRDLQAGEASETPPEPIRLSPMQAGLSQSRLRVSVVLILLVLVAGLVLIYTEFTIFVVPPIGAVPEGRTLIISRLNKSQFIDSADAMCERIQGGVSLLCRGMVLAAVGKNATIYLRLPYSRSLYLISTGGKVYER